MFWSIKCIYNIGYKMYLQIEQMAKLWVFVSFCDLSNKRRFEYIYKTSLQNETVRWITKRRSRCEVFCKKGVPKNFKKITRKHLCWSLFFNKVAGLRPETLLKKRVQQRCFPVNFVKFFKNTFFKEHLWWLLLYKRFIFVNFLSRKKFWNKSIFNFLV